MIRTVTRLAPEHLILAHSELEKIDFFPVSTGVLNLAENFASHMTLRTLDAVQVATVIFLDRTVKGLVTYDRQMTRAAEALGLTVVAPA